MKTLKSGGHAISPKPFNGQKSRTDMKTFFNKLGKVFCARIARARARGMSNMARSVANWSVCVMGGVGSGAHARASGARGYPVPPERELNQFNLRGRRAFGRERLSSASADTACALPWKYIWT
jgi:hypothetical protein